MTHRHLKAGYFALTALNTVATTLYFNYLFFLLRDRFGFTNRENLWVTALHGFVYIVSAWQCGRFAQKHGYFTSLKLGYATLGALMLAGGMIDSAYGQLLTVFAYSIVLLLTWPALEAIVNEGENRMGVQRMVGIYNCVWASFAAIAYFFGGRLYDCSSSLAVFWLPAAIYAVQLALVLWLEKHAAALPLPRSALDELPHPEATAWRQPVCPKTFLKMAWLANPFAYVAINTLYATMPSIASKLGLSPTKVGLFCSVWLFGRFAAFALLWQWDGWHYRFRWMLAAFVTLVASFLAIVLAPSLQVIVAAQVLFGLASGMAYYASLFYSMDVGETKGEHGGLHEAAIGAGICGGPAIGAAALTLAPASPHAAVYAVTALLLAGLGGLVWFRIQGRK